MTTKDLKRVAVGMFENPDDARRAIEELRSLRFSDSEIGLLTHDRENNQDISLLKVYQNTSNDGVEAHQSQQGIWAIDITTGYLPTVGPVIAGGLLAEAIAPPLNRPPVTGVIDALARLGVGNDELEYYEAEFRSGRTIVVVESSKRAPEAFMIMRRYQSINQFRAQAPQPRS